MMKLYGGAGGAGGMPDDMSDGFPGGGGSAYDEDDAPAPRASKPTGGPKIDEVD